MKPRLERNTPAEEAAIQRGIEQDPDTFVPDDEWFRRARPAHEVMPPELYAELIAKRQLDTGKRPRKAQVTLRLDQDVLDRLRASGPGWEVRVNEALRKLVTGEA